MKPIVESETEPVELVESIESVGSRSSGDPLATLDDKELREDERPTMAELKALAESESDAAESETKAAGDREDELLDALDLPETDHHLGRFAGWRAARGGRWVIAGALAFAALAGTIAFLIHTRDLRYERLHPLPEVEATITPGTPREMSLADGQMRVELSRDPPAINLLHLPDRDITLARGVEKAQFKVEIRDGQTVRIKVLGGDSDKLVETLTRADAQPLL